jgi:hypothetical protein
MSSFNCHRCKKICKSNGGLTNHLKSCISKIKNKPEKNISKENLKNTPQTVKYKDRDMIINWSGSEQYKHIMRPGIYNGQYLASSDEQRNYVLDKL